MYIAPLSTRPRYLAYSLGRYRRFRCNSILHV